jgi:restriction system protein
MSVPDFQSLMLPLLEMSSLDEASIADIIEKLAARLQLTPAERAELLPSGKQAMFNNRVHWAKFHLGKAGLLENVRRGYFRITELGTKTLAAKPTRIDLNYLNRFEPFRQFREKSAAVADADPASELPKFVDQTQTPDELMRSAHKQIDRALAQDLLDRIRAAPPSFFEKLIVNLLLSMGFGGSVVDAGKAIGRSGDDGIDGVIDQDALGLDRIYIQAKRYAEGDFFGSLDRHKAAKGLFVTTSAFSSSARETAAFLSKRIVLIDGDQLAQLMIRHNVGCRIEDTLHIKKLDEDFFEQ